MSFSSSRVLRAVVCACVIGGAVELGGTSRAPASRPTRAGASTILGRLPIDFIENRGQWQTAAKFSARKGEIAAAFEPHAIRLQLGPSLAPVGLVFENASSAVALVGEEKRASVYNYFIGSDASQWRAAVPAYANVLYRGVYEGVDVRVREGAERFEYDLLVAPGTDLSRVVMRAEGVTRIELSPDGALDLQTPDGPLTQTPP